MIQNVHENQEEINRENLLRSRLEFRQLLSDFGLVRLAGGPEDAIEFLEQEAVQLVNSLSRRRRFMQLVNDAREILSQRQKEIRELPNGGREGMGNPHIEAKYRRFQIEIP